MATLNYILQRGTPRKAQLNIIDIFNVPDTLMQRGFEDVCESPIEETLINPDANILFKPTNQDFYSEARLLPKKFIERFNEKKFRLGIKNMVFGKAHPLGQSDFLFAPTELNQRRYAKTVELLIAYLCVQELRAFSASFGVRIKNAPNGGDFDCIANFQSSLFHFEVKSGDVRNIDESTLQSFVHRHSFLAPDASILLLDYQSGNTDSLDNLILKFIGLKVGAIRVIESIKKIQDKNAGKFYTLGSGLMVVDLHNNGDILSNLRSAMQYFHRYSSHNATMADQLIAPEDLGYSAITLG